METNKIICSDNVEYCKSLPQESIDLTVTSPPYDNLRDYRGYSFDFEGIAEQLYRITKNGGVVVWVVNDACIDGSETGTSFKQALYFKQIGFNLFDTMIYMKKGFSNPSLDKYHQVFEYMFVFSKGKPKTFNPIKDRKNITKNRGGDAIRQKDGSMKYGSKGNKANSYFGTRYNIWQYSIGGGVSGDPLCHKHPAAFPEKLARDHIISWSNEGDIVLDPLCGSGTTCKMAELLGRKWIGIDISEEYCQLARQRVKEAQKHFTLFKG